MPTDRSGGLFELLQLARMLLSQITRMLDRLFQARDLRAVPVVVLLNARERLVEFNLGRARVLDVGFDAALLRETRLDYIAPLGQHLLLLPRLGIDRTELERHELGAQPALALLQLLVLL